MLFWRLALLSIGTSVALVGCRGSYQYDPKAGTQAAEQCAQGDIPLCRLIATPTVLVPSIRCDANSVAGWARFGDDKWTPHPPPGPIDAVLILSLRAEAAPCLLSRKQRVSIDVAGYRNLPIRVAESPWNDDDVIVAGTNRTKDGAWFRFTLENWCAGALPVDPVVHVAFPTSTVDTPVESSSGQAASQRLPPCTDGASAPELKAETGFAGRIPEVALAPCRAEDLAVAQGFYIAVPKKAFSNDPPTLRVGDMWFAKNAPPACSVTQWSKLSILDGNGSSIDVRRDVHTPPDIKANIIRGPGSGYVKFDWENWCGKVLPGPLTLRFVLPDDGGTVEWRVEPSLAPDGTIVTPECVDPSADSIFRISKTL